MTETSDSPRTLAVFPLTGTLLLPGTYLPLNIFEPRYLELVGDALAGDRRFGMIQPQVPSGDNFGPVAGAPRHPDLFDVGCIGHIDSWEEQPDGRIVVVLLGESRFRILREISRRSDYRRVEADVAEFAADLQPSNPHIDRPRLLTCLDAMSLEHGFEFDREVLESLDSTRLVNALATALPFGPLEKQALLEARDVAVREELLRSLMEMVPEPLAAVIDASATIN